MRLCDDRSSRATLSFLYISSNLCIQTQRVTCRIFDITPAFTWIAFIIIVVAYQLNFGLISICIVLDMWRWIQEVDVEEIRWVGRKKQQHISLLNRENARTDKPRKRNRQECTQNPNKPNNSNTNCKRFCTNYATFPGDSGSAFLPYIRRFFKCCHSNTKQLRLAPIG